VTIDPLSSEPAYMQLAAILRGRIADGTYERRQPIASLKQLEAETGLAGGTIQKAINVLQAEGLVRPVRGRGTFVL
jgi:GntR family transcriptional regulator